MQKIDKALIYQLNTLASQKPYKGENPPSFWPHMACTTLCRFTLARFHVSCFWCRTRRFFYGKLDRSKYHFNQRLGGIITPNEMTLRCIFRKFYEDRVFFVHTPKGLKVQKVPHMLIDERVVYYLLLDNNRKFSHFKDIFFDKVFKKIEELVDVGDNLSFPKKLELRYLYTAAEALAN